MVVTVDGSAVDSGGRSAGIGSDADRRVFRLLRAGCDALIVGARTATVENYRHRGSNDSFADLRRESHLPPEPELAVVSRRPEVATHRDEAGRPLSPAKLVSRLTRAGRTRILCEGGPELLSVMLSEGLIDELCLTITPLLFGPGCGTGPAGSPGARMLAGPPWIESPVPLSLVSLIEQDGTLLLRWRPRRNSPDTEPSGQRHGQRHG